MQAFIRIGDIDYAVDSISEREFCGIVADYRRHRIVGYSRIWCPEVGLSSLWPHQKEGVGAKFVIRFRDGTEIEKALP